MQAARARETTGEERRAPRVEVGLPSELAIECVEGLRGAEQEGRSFAAATFGVRGLGAQEVQAGALQLVEGPDLGRGQQSTRDVEDARLQARLGGGVGP